MTSVGVFAILRHPVAGLFLDRPVSTLTRIVYFTESDKRKKDGDSVLEEGESLLFGVYFGDFGRS